MERILIIEDELPMRTALQDVLAGESYRVLTAPDGETGLARALKEKPDLILLDIMMPKLDGFGLVHRLRINPETRDIPVVFITATYIAREDREFALHIGATRFLQKPVDLEKFLATIAELQAQGLPTVIKPLNEVEFYQEYRKRLQVKRDEKIKQIAREEHLLATGSDKDDASLHVSLRHAVLERDELEILLGQIDEQLAKHRTSI